MKTFYVEVNISAFSFRETNIFTRNLIQQRRLDSTLKIHNKIDVLPHLMDVFSFQQNMLADDYGRIKSFLKLYTISDCRFGFNFN